MDSPKYNPVHSSKPSPWNGQDVTIEMREVTKRFYIYEHQVDSLRESFIRVLSSRMKDIDQSHFSLDNISLSIRSGETWALIGPNGAGKSTLLRIMAGIYWPTSGVVITRGRLAALIELTAGFHPELTGRENVYLYGAILGFSNNELSRRYGEIVQFAGIEEFMSTPVKYYSSGMRMRLGFAVSTAVEPDILLLDEVFAVGDAEFRERCLERIQSFQNSGCTLVIATHELDTALTFATRAAWIDRGCIRLQGSAEEVVAAYVGSSP